MTLYQINVTMRAYQTELDADSEEEAVKEFVAMIDDGDFFPESDDYIVTAKVAE